MEANSFTPTWDDLIFENRNKSYGAYPLRRAYPDRVFAGLAATVIFVAALLLLHNRERTIPPVKPPVNADRGTLVVVTPPSIPVKPKATAVVRLPKETKARNTTVLVTREEVEDQEEEVIPEYLSDGDVEFGDVVAGVSDAGTGTGFTDIPLVTEESDEPFDIAEVMPEYEGGMEAMMKFIQKKIRYPRAPLALGIDGTVYVRFVVNGDGSVSNVEVMRGIHRDCDREAVRVVSLLPAWKGGKHRGRPVPVRMVLPIRFNLGSGH